MGWCIVKITVDFFGVSWYDEIRVYGTFTASRQGRGGGYREGMDQRGALSGATGPGGDTRALRPHPEIGLPAALPRAAHHRAVQRSQRLRAAQGRVAPVLSVVPLGGRARAQVLVSRHQPGSGALAERRHRLKARLLLRQPRHPLGQRYLQGRRPGVLLHRQPPGRGLDPHPLHLRRAAGRRRPSPQAGEAAVRPPGRPQRAPARPQGGVERGQRDLLHLHRRPDAGPAGLRADLRIRAAAVRLALRRRAEGARLREVRRHVTSSTSPGATC